MTGKRASFAIGLCLAYLLGAGIYVALSKQFPERDAPSSDSPPSPQTVLRADAPSRSQRPVRRPAEPAPVPAVVPARFVDHVRDLELSLPRGFHVVVQDPFVVVGNDEPQRVREYAVDVVGWATQLLRRDYFASDPAHIVDVWLFKDADSYERHCAERFDWKPTTPYGSYLAPKRAMVMNISTGRGTLVHEMVHAFIATDFPGCPIWFNEGLASLYEKPGDVDGRLHGYPNWRLPPLQDGIRQGKTRSLASMMRSLGRTFHQDPHRYAQARYLCYYLQERDLLRRFYRDFRGAREKDPSGIKTLRHVLGEHDLDAFERRWNEFVLKLTPMDRQLRWRAGRGYQPVVAAAAPARAS